MAAGRNGEAVDPLRPPAEVRSLVPAVVPAEAVVRIIVVGRPVPVGHCRRKEHGTWGHHGRPDESAEGRTCYEARAPGHHAKTGARRGRAGEHQERRYPE